MITIEPLKTASEAAAREISLLLPQLRENSSEHTATLEELRTIVSDKNIVLMTVKDDDRVVGIASLYIMPKFSKTVAHVEDVVVDNQYRGEGLGEKLMRAMIDEARDRGIRTLSLTSRPERVAGNKLYQKLGFEQKTTNVYRLKL